MYVSELMTTGAKSCGINDNLWRAAQLMWENDCGVVPVVDGDERVVGMITDRDICMAAFMRGQNLCQMAVANTMSTFVYGVLENERLESVEALMRRVRVRRVPVLDADGRLKGILSLNDLARQGHRSTGRRSNGITGDSIMQTLSAIGEPRDGARNEGRPRSA